MAAFGVAVIAKEVFVEIQLLKKHGFSLRQIAKEVGCAVNTVRRHPPLPRLDFERGARPHLAKLTRAARSSNPAGRPRS